MPGSIKLLVIGSNRINYYNLFNECGVNGVAIEVEQANWDDISVASHGGTNSARLVLSLKPPYSPLPGTPQDAKRSRNFLPDIILLRAATQGGANVDHRQKLSALAHSGIPMINSLTSFYLAQDKAVLYGKMMQVKLRIGHEAFPLIPQTCYTDMRATSFSPDFPCVGKIGTASGGLGKMKLHTPEQWDDFVSCTAMQSQYFTSEPAIKWRYDIRIQKIGSHYRAFKRESSKHWKSNCDMTTKDFDCDMLDRWRVMIDEAALACGSMDICAIDMLETEDGKEFILELNSSSIGFNRRHEKEDCLHLRDLVLLRIEAMNSKPPLPAIHSIVACAVEDATSGSSSSLPPSTSTVYIGEMKSTLSATAGDLVLQNRELVFEVEKLRLRLSEVMAELSASKDAAGTADIEIKDPSCGITEKSSFLGGIFSRK